MTTATSLSESDSEELNLTLHQSWANPVLKGQIRAGLSILGSRFLPGRTDQA